nr:ABC transporter substrate-binding protein [uncultured Rhodoferax sp.]
MKLPNALNRRHTLALAGAFVLPKVAIAQARPIKIGYVSAFSGVRAPFGVADEWHIARMRAQLKDGIEIGGKRYPVEIIVKDNQSEANRSQQVASDLILREKVDLLLVQDGEATFAAGPLCDVHGVPMISTMTPWQAFMFARKGNVNKGFPFSFNFFWGADEVTRNFIAMWDSVKTNKTVGTLYVDNPVGQALADPVRGMPAMLRSGGYTEAASSFFKISTDDFSNQIASFKAKNTQILSGFMYENHFATFWKQAQQTGLRPEICSMGSAFLFPSALKALGSAGNGMTTEVWWSPTFPYRSSITGQSAQAFAADWEKTTGNQWTQPLGYTHAIWEVALHALKTAADPLDRKAVRDAIQDCVVDTIVGKVDFKNSPIKSVAKTELVAGQWRKTPDGSRFPFELVVVNNQVAKNIPLGGELKLLSQLK